MLRIEAQKRARDQLAIEASATQKGMAPPQTPVVGDAGPLPDRS
jgi:hypothetical protein